MVRLLLRMRAMALYSQINRVLESLCITSFFATNAKRRQLCGRNSTSLPHVMGSKDDLSSNPCCESSLSRTLMLRSCIRQVRHHPLPRTTTKCLVPSLALPKTRYLSTSKSHSSKMEHHDLQPIFTKEACPREIPSPYYSMGSSLTIFS